MSASNLPVPVPLTAEAGYFAPASPARRSAAGRYAGTVPFNRPFVAGKELFYIAQAVTFGNLGGDGHFTRQCSTFLKETFGSAEVLMTPSCTAALEMAAMLCELQPGDEVIMPSYTFVSTANAFVRQGATPVFVDIRPDTLNLNEALIEDAITDRTRVVVPVHYAGVGCEMDRIMNIAKRHNLLVVEDAAQAVNARYDRRYLGTIGHLGCYSFHETKNYICGEGGALAVNDERFLDRARIIRDKGTNRHAFLQGHVDKYTWVDEGSSYVPSELCCAFLSAQLEQLEGITARRRQIFQHYLRELRPLADSGLLQLPHTPDDCNGNFHMFYILLPTQTQRDALLAWLNANRVNAVFHFVPLHSSPMGRRVAPTVQELNVTTSVSGRLLRLPFFHDITTSELNTVVAAIRDFFRQNSTDAAD